MTSTPAEVAALLKIAAMEPETLDDLDGCLRRLRDVQKARRELAKVPRPCSCPDCWIGALGAVIRRDRAQRGRAS